jgi:hypothetical protein
MSWISKPTIEAKIARAFGYEYCTLFDSARSAIATWSTKTWWWPGEIPSNVCPALWATMGWPLIVPVNPETGLAGVGVHLYGYRDFRNVNREIDPLMTGYLREPRAKETVISFGRKKMLDIGAGGALLSNTKPWFGYFPEGLRWALTQEFTLLHHKLGERWRRVEWWDCYLADSCVRIPGEQLMPWRVMRRIPDQREGQRLRDFVVQKLREAGHDVGTNYAPLPGVIDPGAIQWGREVINFFVGPDQDQNEIRRACELIKRTIAP